MTNTPSQRMFQSWFVVSDLQCFCPPCSNRLAFAFGKRQPRGVASPLPLSERCLNLKKVDTNSNVHKKKCSFSGKLH